jgi:hypothetical protein
MMLWVGLTDSGSIKKTSGTKKSVSLKNEKYRRNTVYGRYLFTNILTYGDKIRLRFPITSYKWSNPVRFETSRPAWGLL